MLKSVAKQMLLTFALTCTGVASADADPTLHEVYAAADAGHLDQAQQMMAQVLRDHPNSAKAHYVAAELHARNGDVARARDELNTAERLEPGLPFAKPQAVQTLKAELGAAVQAAQPPTRAAAGASFPWGIALALFAGLAVFWMMMRRRSSNAVYAQAPAPMTPPAGMPGSYGGPAASGGMGSGIVGGLASGLAVGAGVVAGEQLARHFLDGDRHAGSGPAPAENNVVETPANSDMGGSDFGVADSGSWDDGGSAGGGMDDSDWS